LYVFKYVMRINCKYISAAFLRQRQMSTIAIVGGGPVGSLAALYFSRLSLVQVTLYELRPGSPLSRTLLRLDPRIPSNKAALPNKSINLALSDRGIAAIEEFSEELAREMLARTIPMRGRCLHDRSGKQVTQFYDVYGRVRILMVL
jgi:kynurenine 3-monooxygenase